MIRLLLPIIVITLFHTNYALEFPKIASTNYIVIPVPIRPSAQFIDSVQIEEQDEQPVGKGAINKNSSQPANDDGQSLTKRQREMILILASKGGLSV
ncbi:hypothetical protein EKK58_03475 [Candidatus Dependentiae bacterium]|nr:MAG: hypothetical protein EKK58_03475 [Candidatus Dependentiae bacterium]